MPSCENGDHLWNSQRKCIFCKINRPQEEEGDYLQYLRSIAVQALEDPIDKSVPRSERDLVVQAEILIELIDNKAELEQLRSQLSSNDMTLGAYINRERDMALQIADLLSQLSASESDLKAQQQWAAGEIESVRASLREQTQKCVELQAEIARLKSPPEERTDISARHALRKDALARHPGIPMAAETVVEDIETLLQDAARDRNARVILMNDVKRLTAANAEYTRRHVEQVARIDTLERCLFQAQEAAKEIELSNRILRSCQDNMGSVIASHVGDKVELRKSIERLEAVLRNQPCACKWVTAHGVECTGEHHGAKAAVCSRCEELGGQFIPWEALAAADGQSEAKGE